MNKVIIIIGGANGLGREFVKESLKLGLYVCNIDRDIECMNKMSQEYRENYKGFIGDVSDEKQASFMNPKDVAEIILSNVMSDTNLTVADLIIERNS